MVVPVQALNTTAAVATADGTALAVAVAAIPGMTWKMTSSPRYRPDVYPGCAIWNAQKMTVMSVSASVMCPCGVRPASGNR